MTDKELTKAIVECDELPNCLKNEILNMEQNETTLQGWVCRDKRDNVLLLHSAKPYRASSGCGDYVGEIDVWESEEASFFTLDTHLFPQITWESEPCEVEITIKIKGK